MATNRTVWAASLVLVTAMFVLNGVMAYRNADLLAASAAQSVHSREAEQAIDAVLQALVDAETGQRGYLLSGRETYLAPFQASVRRIDEQVAELMKLCADRPAQAARAQQLHELVARKLAELQRTLDLARSGQRDGALAIVDTDDGMVVMSHVRATVEAMRDSELEEQRARDAQAAEVYARSRYNAVFGVVAGLIAVAIAAMLLRRYLRTRARAAAVVHRQREWLHTTLRSIGDAVIVTDPDGVVQLFNRVAEELTGWSRDEAVGRPLAEVFEILDEDTRLPSANPVVRALAEGKAVGLANHTILRARGGREYVIEDSAAPTFDADGHVQGVVLVFHDGTERRRAEIALSEASAEIARRAKSALIAERTLATILDNAPIGICMTGPGPDWPIVALSRQMHEWIGAAEGTPALEAYHKLLPDGREPPPDLIPLYRVMVHGRSVRDEPWQIARKEGEPLTVIVNVAPVRDSDGHIVAAIHSWMDLTERQRLDHALRVSQSRLRVLLDSNVIGMILSFDGRGRVAQANAAFLDMLGFGAADVDGRALNLDAQTPPEFHEADRRAFAEVRASGFCTPFEKAFVTRTGVRVPVVVGYARIADAEDEYVGFALDISARKQLERRLREQAEALITADRHKDEFLAMLAHELRNPLAPLRNAVHLLAEARGDAATDSAAELLPVMRRQIDHLVHLVDDLLDAARISQGKIVVSKTAVELWPVLRNAIENMQGLIEQRDHTLAIDAAPPPIYVNGDATRLTQMVSNVLHNAAKYTPRGGRIEMSLVAEGDEAVIRVTDNGQGIAAAVLPRIFDTFVQDDQSLARSAGGLGVGLALVRKLALLHGGSVSAASDGPGRGATFTLRLPRVEAPPAATPALAASPVAPAPALRVLVVDDNVDLVASTVSLLELWGHEVRTLHGGREVADVALVFRPHVILLDIGLPGMDGYAVAKALSTIRELDATRVVAVTGYGQERDRMLATAAGFDAHLVKPVQPARLKALLDDLAR